MLVFVQTTHQNRLWNCRNIHAEKQWIMALFWKNNYDESIVETLCINFLSKQKSVNKKCQLCLWCINLSSAFFFSFSAILRTVCWCKLGENVTCLTTTGMLLDFYLEWTQPWIKIMHMAVGCLPQKRETMKYDPGCPFSGINLWIWRIIRCQNTVHNKQDLYLWKVITMINILSSHVVVSR